MSPVCCIGRVPSPTCCCCARFFFYVCFSFILSSCFPSLTIMVVAFFVCLFFGVRIIGRDATARRVRETGFLRCPRRLPYRKRSGDSFRSSCPRCAPRSRTTSSASSRTTLRLPEDSGVCDVFVGGLFLYCAG